MPGATGPADCPTVYLVMSDPELRDQLHAFQRTAQDAGTVHHGARSGLAPLGGRKVPPRLPTQPGAEGQHRRPEQ
nr:hypothetical protein GCM10020063_048180 [Dactylosporangium thailandense]